MSDQTFPASDAELVPGGLVAPAEGLAGVQSPEGGLVDPEHLGPGIVKHLGEYGKVYVHWELSDFGSWMEGQDLRSFGPDAHLIAVVKRDKRGNTSPLRHRVDTTKGLNHNWTVEMLPDDVVRAVRDDGLAWTFALSQLSKGIKDPWPQPPKDDDAEAVAAADLALLAPRR